MAGLWLGLALAAHLILLALLPGPLRQAVSQALTLTLVRPQDSAGVSAAQATASPVKSVAIAPKPAHGAERAKGTAQSTEQLKTDTPHPTETGSKPALADQRSSKAGAGSTGAIGTSIPADSDSQVGSEGGAAADGDGTASGGGSSGSGDKNGSAAETGTSGGAATSNIDNSKQPPAPDAPEPERQAVEEPKVDVKALLTAYGNTAKRAILGRRHYPEVAKRLGHSGSVKVRLVIAQDGGLQSVEVVSSSGFNEIDSAALQAVRDAAPFGAFPAGVDKASQSYTFKLDFTLN